MLHQQCSAGIVVNTLHFNSPLHPLANNPRVQTLLQANTTTLDRAPSVLLNPLETMQYLSKIMLLGLMAFLLLVPANSHDQPDYRFLTCGTCSARAQRDRKPDPQVLLQCQAQMDTHTCNGLRPAGDGCGKGIVVQMYKCPACQIVVWASVSCCKPHGYPPPYYTRE
jgi:hypothetical protein